MSLINASEINQSIDDFVSSFRKHIDSIEKITVEHNTRRYRKILFVSVIEGLAKCRYPTKRPRARFVKFVRKYGDWEFTDNISLPHLVAALERTSVKQFDPLREYAFKELSKWGTVGPLYLDKDPTKSEIQSRWPKINEASIEIPCLKKIDQFCHIELLYKYRNYLVHESRQPTMGFDSERDCNPFYESIGSYDCSEGIKVAKFHLVYPSGFLCKLSKTCLKNLEKYLLANNRNPFDSFKFGDYLIEELNDIDSFPIREPFYKI